MPVGTCALCLGIRELRDSHFLPAGFCRIMRDGSGEDPVLVNKSAAFMSSAQARAHSLCGECEHRFNDGGDLHNRVSAMPWLFERKPEYRSDKFIATGLTFHMFFRMMISKPMRRMCSARHGFLHMSEDRDSDLLKTMAVMATRVERKGKLRTEPQAV